MQYEEYTTFILITFLVMISPGPAVIHAINNGIKYGYKVSSWGVLGNVVALMLLVLVSSIGLGAVLVTSDILFKVLKFVGAAYLFYLGVKIWFSEPIKKENIDIKTKIKTPFLIFRESFLVTASNPKALAYVTALLPQFLDTNENIMSQIVLLSITIVVVQFSVLMSYVCFASYAKQWLAKEKVGKIFNKITALALICFGILLGSSNKMK